MCPIVRKCGCMSAFFLRWYCWFVNVCERVWVCVFCRSHDGFVCIGRCFFVRYFLTQRSGWKNNFNWHTAVFNFWALCPAKWDVITFLNYKCRRFCISISCLFYFFAWVPARVVCLYENLADLMNLLSSTSCMNRNGIPICNSIYWWNYFDWETLGSDVLLRALIVKTGECVILH